MIITALLSSLLMTTPAMADQIPITINSTTSPTLSDAIHDCKEAGGTVFSRNILESEIYMCKFQNSIVGLYDYYYRDLDFETPFSIFNYRNKVRTCPEDMITLIKTSPGKFTKVCVYADESVIDIQSLENGYLTGKNTLLDKALNFPPID